MPQGGTDKKEERFLFVEMKPREGKDEIVLTISHLSLEEQQDPPAAKHTSAPGAKAAKPKPQRQTKGRLANPRDTLRNPHFSCGRAAIIKV